MSLTISSLLHIIILVASSAFISITGFYLWNGCSILLKFMCVYQMVNLFFHLCTEELQGANIFRARAHYLVDSMQENLQQQLHVNKTGTAIRFVPSTLQ